MKKYFIFALHVISIYVHCIKMYMIKSIKLLIMMIKIIYAKNIMIHLLNFVNLVMKIFV